MNYNPKYLNPNSSNLSVGYYAIRVIIKVTGKDWKYTYAAPRRIDNLYAGDSDFPQYRGSYFGDKGYYITLTNGKFEVKKVIFECITAVEK